MPSLTIPEAGLKLQNSHDPRSKNGAAIPSAVGLTLTDEQLEDMIQCFQNEKLIQLSLGETPSLHIGSKIKPLYISDDPFPHELYRTPTSTNPESKAITSTMNYLFANKNVKTIPPKVRTIKAPIGGSHVAKGFDYGSLKPASVTAGTDQALAELQNSLAEVEARKQENTTKYIKDGAGLPGPGRRTAAPAKLSNKSKFPSKNNRSLVNTTRSMPSSPALSGVDSPSLGPTSVPLAEQQFERSKIMRKPIVHLLAFKPMTEQELTDRVTVIPVNEIKAAIAKVSDLNETTRKYELRKPYWRELDVWNFDYDTEEDRQCAIDNAVKQYDKARMATSEPHWERLLPKAERSTGKCLSKLQAQIATGHAQRAPKIKIQDADGSGADTPSGGAGKEDLFGDGEKILSKAMGEAMSRSISNPPAAKSKRVSEKEAQAKRLLSNTTTPASKTAKPAAKTLPPKKEKAGTQPLSSQFVSDTDEEDDYMMPVKQTQKPGGRKPEQPRAKRPREEEVDTSDSSLPLSKKFKETPAHRVSDTSQNFRTTSSSTNSFHSTKSKGTSPQKSSPLASSPPTNASEFENSPFLGLASSSASPVHPVLSHKSSRSPIHRRHQKTSSIASISSSSAHSSTSQRRLKPEVMELAIKFKTFYPAYQKLYQEIEDLLKIKRKASENQLEKLNGMHSRLSQLKRDISAGVEEIQI